MSNQVIVDLLVEDRAHESFLEPLLCELLENRIRISKGPNRGGNQV